MSKSKLQNKAVSNYGTQARSRTDKIKVTISSFILSRTVCGKLFLKTFLATAEYSWKPSDIGGPTLFCVT